MFMFEFGATFISKIRILLVQIGQKLYININSTMGKALAKNRRNHALFERLFLKETHETFLCSFS